MEEAKTQLSYAELKAEAEKILALVQQAKAQEKEAVIREIKAKMAEFDIKPEEIGLAQPKKRGRPRIVKIRYRGPNGEAWSGLGRRPRWVLEAITRGENLDQYRVQ